MFFGGRRGGGGEATVEELGVEGGAIGVRGAATELFDEEARHLKPPSKAEKHFTQSSQSAQRTQKRGESILYLARTHETTQPAAAAPNKDSGFEGGGKDERRARTAFGGDCPFITGGCAATIFHPPWPINGTTLPRCKMRSIPSQFPSTKRS